MQGLARAAWNCPPLRLRLTLRFCSLFGLCESVGNYRCSFQIIAAQACQTYTDGHVGQEIRYRASEMQMDIFSYHVR